LLDAAGGGVILRFPPHGDGPGDSKVGFADI
jgi:hypothetical protein